jgi:peptide/nickel transport system substrate-binding protein
MSLLPQWVVTSCRRVSGEARAHFGRTLSTLVVIAALCSPVTAETKLKTLSVVMHSDLRVIDPIYTTAYIARDHGYMVYDTLLATDSHQQIRPQMADWKISDDKLTYTFTLRDGLKWHDGQPVTAEDCVLSMKRWSARDAMGQKLMDFTASLEATDAKTITLKLREPYAYVLESLAKPSAMAPFMMPKRLAETSPDKPIPEQIGSGPFKFVAAEFQPGIRAVYVKNTDYVPRSESPDGFAGGKVVKVDRVEWITMADAQTALNALYSGDIDFVEVPQWDMLPVLEKDPRLVVHTLNELGRQTVGRMNFLHPPFNNVKIRRAALLALRQKDILEASVGSPKYYRICGALFGCGMPLESDVGAETLVQGNGMAHAKKLLAESGYDGIPVVIMAPTDLVAGRTQPIVAAQLLREAGFKVDVQAMDWQTLVTRRTSQKPPKEGGWNMFFTNIDLADIANPITYLQINAKGTKGGWFGWPEDSNMEELRDAYARAQSLHEQKELATEIQARNYDQVISIPLGQYKIVSVWRKEISGLLDVPAPPIFWNVEKAE